MESFSSRPEKIDPVRVGVVLDRLQTILDEYKVGHTMETITGLAHPELTGLNEHSVFAADESEVAERLNFWCDQLQQHLMAGGAAEDFVAHTVWFVPLLQNAVAIQEAK